MKELMLENIERIKQLMRYCRVNMYDSLPKEVSLLETENSFIDTNILITDEKSIDYGSNRKEIKLTIQGSSIKVKQSTTDNFLVPSISYVRIHKDIEQIINEIKSMKLIMGLSHFEIDFDELNK